MIGDDNDLKSKTKAELIAYAKSLRRHKVYGAWNADGNIIYGGQSTNPDRRRFEHIVKADPNVSVF